MKQLILLLAGILLLAPVAKASEVPVSVQQAFIQKFPGVKNVKWEKEKGNEYEAEFELNGRETSATFDAEGNWKETECEINPAELPSPVTEALSKLYPGRKVKEASRISRRDNSVVYEAEIRSGLKTKELLFDDKGNAIKG